MNYGSLKDTMNQANLPLHLLEVKLHFQQGMPINSYTTIHIGANAKLISSLENYNSLGGAIDIGAILLTKEMTLIGVSNQNIGTQFTTYLVQEKLPPVIVGVSQELEHVPSMASTLENLQQWNVAFQIQEGIVA
jgi:hypothetical protein